MALSTLFQVLAALLVLHWPHTRTSTKSPFTGSTAVGKKIVEGALGQPEKSHAGTGRQITGCRVPRCRSRSRQDWRRTRRILPAGTELYGWHTPVRAHEKVFDEVIQGIAAIANSMKIGPGLNPSNQLGPLISAQQRETVMKYIQAGKDEGAELICGGEALPGKGFFVQPTIFTHPNQDITIAREEIFGPVLFAQPFGDE